jgi:hypothetical protein
MRRQLSATRLRFLLTPVFAFLLASCSHTLLDPELPGGTREFTPPAVYQVWWSMTAECSGKRAAVSGVEWFVVPGVTEFEHEGRLVSGYWSRASNRIVLAEKAVLDGPLVRHEMLHSLEHDAGHHRQAFLQRCGGVVVCITSCLDEAGRPPVPRPGLARVTPEAMAIDVRVDPGAPGSATDEGHFRLTVFVRNPRGDSVVVQLPSSRDAAPPASFSFQLSGETMGLWYNERAWDAGLTVFAPGETRRAVYDFRIAPKFDGLRAIPPGAYGVRGGFGSASSATRTFVLAP